MKLMKNIRDIESKSLWTVEVCDMETVICKKCKHKAELIFSELYQDWFFVCVNTHCDNEGMAHAETSRMNVDELENKDFTLD